MKKITLAILTLAILLSTIAGLSLSVSADSMYIRRVVSVVYDDSGSMDNERYNNPSQSSKAAHASYALQAFCGMLNSEDTMYITSMKDVLQGSSGRKNFGDEPVDLSPNGIQELVDKISKLDHNANYTPFEAVEIAFEKLKNHKNSDPNTQYWLVVITDGGFHVKESNDWRDFYIGEVNTAFEGYVSTTMDNGSNPQITFLGIGEKAPQINSDEAKGIHSYKAANADQIREKMSEMSVDISGRAKVAEKDIKQINSNTVQVESSIPILNIAALVQKKGIELSGATTEEGNTIPIVREAVLKGYKPSNANWDQKIEAGSYLLGDSQSILPAGKYNITFSEAVDVESLTILFEPALEMRMTFTINGKEIPRDEIDDALKNASENDEIAVSCNLYQMGTNNPIDNSLMPDGTTFEFKIVEDGKVVEHKTDKDDMSSSKYVLKNVPTEITASVIIEGFRPIQETKKFTPSVYVPKTVYTIEPSFGGEETSVKFDNIKDNKDMTICFTVFADGEEITDNDAVKALEPQIITSPDGNTGTTTYSDGKIIFTPNSAALPSAVSKDYDVEVMCKINDGTISKPINYTVLTTKYTVEASFGGADKSVKFDNIKDNKDMTICFTVFADGVAITDVNAIKALDPRINVSPQGNSGTTTIGNDGKIIFTPNSATIPSADAENYDVEVTCTLNNGESSEPISYTVLIAIYEVIAVDNKTPIKKTELYQNTQGVSFYITKDKEKLLKSAVEQGITVILNDEHKDLLYTVIVADDGTITVTPYTDDEWSLNFGTWWLNGWRYLGLEGSDIEVTFSHKYGTATSIIDIVEEDLVYILLNVVTPIVLELAILFTLIAYIYCILAKPKFGKNAVIYSGRLMYDSSSNTNIVLSMSKKSLSRYNKLKYRMAFTTKSKVISVGGIKVSAARGGRIECHEPGPSFRGNIKFVHDSSKQLPAEILNYCKKFNVEFNIKPFTPIATIEKSSIGIIGPTGKALPSYFVIAPKPDIGAPFNNGKIFIYLTEI